MVVGDLQWPVSLRVARCEADVEAASMRDDRFEVLYGDADVQAFLDGEGVEVSPENGNRGVEGLFKDL